MKRALLLSGGLDSTAIAWWKRPETAIFVDHGQCAAFAERRAAEAVAAACGIEFVALRVDCSSLGSGQMAGREQLPEAPTPEWWPFRNQLLVTIAAAAALPKGVKELMIGTIADDGTNGDGTRAFVDRLAQSPAIAGGRNEPERPSIRHDGCRAFVDVRRAARGPWLVSFVFRV